MTLLVRNVLVSFSLAISDLLGFVTSIYLAIWIMFFLLMIHPIFFLLQ